MNIGDIAHTPGVLALIARHIPEAEVRLWASGDLSDEVAAMEHRRFPGLGIVKGSIGADGKASNADLADAVAWCDFLLHGSGPSFVAAKDVAAFETSTGKPFGIYGITYGGAGEAQRALMSRARFAYFRDSVSLEKAKAEGVVSPVMEFGPDGAFACDLRNDAAADAFLRANGLEAGKFLCCIPRLRNTPYWKIKDRPFDAAKHERNEAMSTYVRSAGLFGLEMHSPIMCIGNGVPALVGRFAEQTSKGIMWRDIGLGEWLFDFDRDEEIRRFLPAVLAMARDPVAARAKAGQALAAVGQLQRATLRVVAANLKGIGP